MKKAELKEFLDEFNEIYTMPLEEETEEKKGGSWPAYNYAIQKLEKMYTTVKVCDKAFFLINEKKKTAMHKNVCNHSCKYFLCSFVSFIFVKF